jgi:hypothetical protein
MDTIESKADGVARATAQQLIDKDLVCWLDCFASGTFQAAGIPPPSPDFYASFLEALTLFLITECSGTPCERLAVLLRFSLHDAPLDSCGARTGPRAGGEQCSHPPKGVVYSEATALAVCLKHCKDGEGEYAWVMNPFERFTELLTYTSAARAALAPCSSEVLAFLEVVLAALISGGLVPSVGPAVPTDVDGPLRAQLEALTVQRDLAVADAVRSKTRIAILAKMNARLEAETAAADAARKTRAPARDPYDTPRWQPFVGVTLEDPPVLNANPLKARSGPLAPPLSSSQIEQITLAVASKLGWSHTQDPVLQAFLQMPEDARVALMSDAPGVDPEPRQWGKKNSGLPGSGALALGWARKVFDSIVSSIEGLLASCKNAARNTVGPLDAFEGAARLGWDTLLVVLDSVCTSMHANHQVLNDANGLGGVEAEVSKFSVTAALIEALTATLKDIHRLHGPDAARRIVVMHFSYQLSMSLACARSYAEFIVKMCTGTEDAKFVRVPRGRLGPHTLSLLPYTKADSPMTNYAASRQSSPAVNLLAVVQSLDASQIKLIAKILAPSGAGDGRGDSPSAGQVARMVLQSESWRALARPVASFFTKFAAIDSSETHVLAPLIVEAKALAAAWATATRQEGGSERRRGARGGSGRGAGGSGRAAQ